MSDAEEQTATVKALGVFAANLHEVRRCARRLHAAIHTHLLPPPSSDEWAARADRRAGAETQQQDAPSGAAHGACRRGRARALSLSLSFASLWHLPSLSFSRAHISFSLSLPLLLSHPATRAASANHCRAPRSCRSRARSTLCSRSSARWTRRRQTRPASECRAFAR